jgi:anti-anti-sigma factor
MTEYTFSEPAPGQLVLEGELTIYGASAFKDLLLSRLHANPELSVSLSNVSSLDCSAVQVMLLAQNEAHMSGKSIVWQQHSEAVCKVLNTLNLGGIFGAPASLVWS